MDRTVIIRQSVSIVPRCCTEWPEANDLCHCVILGCLNAARHGNSSVVTGREDRHSYTYSKAEPWLVCEGLDKQDIGWEKIWRYPSSCLVFYSILILNWRLHDYINTTDDWWSLRNIVKLSRPRLRDRRKIIRKCPLHTAFKLNAARIGHVQSVAPRYWRLTQMYSKSIKQTHAHIQPKWQKASENLFADTQQLEANKRSSNLKLWFY